MSSSEIKIKASNHFITVVTKCLYNAVGDDIKEDTKGLVTQNGTPSRIWDLINRNIYDSFDASDIIAKPTKRGAWAMVPVFERDTNTIYSLMRENRFSELKKHLPKRRIAHYIDALSRTLNSDLLAPQLQMSLLETTPKSFNNETQLQEIVAKIIHDLGVPNEVVSRHALILFRTFNDELSSVRCCIVDSNLDIVVQADWSNYIKASEGIIVEKVIDRTSSYVDPTSGLQFKQKAKNKLGQKQIPKEKTVEKESDDIS